MKMKKESEKAGLKLNIQRTKIMASDPITSWQIDGETMETVTDFIFLGSKISANGDCSHEIKRCLILEGNGSRIRDEMTRFQRLLFRRLPWEGGSFWCSGGHGRWNTLSGGDFLFKRRRPPEVGVERVQGLPRRMFVLPKDLGFVSLDMQMTPPLWQKAQKN